ncbi:homoserine dehydrogenase [Novosphingobium malaysiense]|uniref:homoserine dehydrogenase n=1 Tax=Novosphingobium malaysiense TaxID=1348853 RepID=UPI001E3C6ECE|nr:homoserine dehydrogenase [Novosphingobium malaysiense]
MGRQIARMLLARRSRYRNLYGVDVRLVAVCNSRAGLRKGAGIEEVDFASLVPGSTGPAFLVEAKPDVLIEAGPSDFETGSPGLAYLRTLLAMGCDGVVVSKGALVHSGPPLRRLAAATGARLRISGATAAALPTIDVLETGLLGCRVLGLEGVLNATTNYLLNAMMERGIGFPEALREAQAGGFAESEPSRDIEGWDTACKLLILANFGLDLDLGMKDVSVSGIGGVTLDDIGRWREEGTVPRLVGRIEFREDGPKAEVALRTYPLDDPFAHIAGKAKALRIHTDCMGEILTMGGGPEPTATASAALKDFELLLATPR